MWRISTGGSDGRSCGCSMLVLLPCSVVGARWRGGSALMAGLPSAVVAWPFRRAAGVVVGQCAPLQLGAVGLVGFCQLQPAGLEAELGVPLGKPALPEDRVEVDGPGLLGGLAQPAADLLPAAALLTRLARGQPAPAGQAVDQLAVGRQRLQRAWPLGPLRIALEPRQGLLISLLTGLLQRQAHGAGHRPVVPGLPRRGERTLGQLALLVGASLFLRGGALLVSAHDRPPFGCWLAGCGRVEPPARRRARAGRWPGAGGRGPRRRGCGPARPARRAAAGGPGRGLGRPVW